ncbi:hypothetical protein LX32DRAFT_188499 [Colletotrichum zoysiae]|uniref:Uncharacterized protein n=1 Tax=Colletotrichum zoysiae TaxID=1216348 RepID=A0AAD9LUI2_9PEZI|nr:hypothetical protein LX32DRAFT_188499 [Colletotrichum zoysiae]
MRLHTHRRKTVEQVGRRGTGRCALPMASPASVCRHRQVVDPFRVLVPCRLSPTFYLGHVASIFKGKAVCVWAESRNIASAKRTVPSQVEPRQTNILAAWRASSLLTANRIPTCAKPSVHPSIHTHRQTDRQTDRHRQTGTSPPEPLRLRALLARTGPFPRPSVPRPRRLYSSPLVL